MPNKVTVFLSRGDWSVAASSLKRKLGVKRNSFKINTIKLPEFDRNVLHKHGKVPITGIRESASVLKMSPDHLQVRQKSLQSSEHKWRAGLLGFRDEISVSNCESSSGASISLLGPTGRPHFFFRECLCFMRFMCNISMGWERKGVEGGEVS